MTSKILRLPEVNLRSGLPRSTLYLRISQGLWTKPISLGARTVGWICSEVDEINAARISGKSDDEVRALVKRLEASRKSCGGDSHA